MFYKPSRITKILRSLASRLWDRLENNNNAEFSMNGEEIFLRQLFELHAQSSELVLFDVGANIGEYSQMLQRYAEMNRNPFSIHVFEPTRKCFSILTDKFNSSGAFVLNNKALSDADGVFDIYYDEEQSGLASLYKRNLNHYDIQLSKTERIEAIRAESYIYEAAIEHIHFLKLDVEGHELSALAGFGRYLDAGFIDFIQFEYGGTNLDSKTSLLEHFTLLQSKGFLMAKVMPGGLEVRDYNPQMEVFRYSNYVAFSENVARRSK